MAKATINSGASLSAPVDLGVIGPKTRVVAIKMSDDWTAAALTFQASSDNKQTWDNLYDQGGTEVSITVAADRYIVLDQDTAAKLTGIRHIRVRSGTAGTPVNQDAERVIDLVVA